MVNIAGCFILLMSVCFGLSQGRTAPPSIHVTLSGDVSKAKGVIWTKDKGQYLHSVMVDKPACITIAFQNGAGLKKSVSSYSISQRNGMIYDISFIQKEEMQEYKAACDEITEFLDNAGVPSKMTLEEIKAKTRNATETAKHSVLLRYKARMLISLTHIKLGAKEGWVVSYSIDQTSNWPAWRSVDPVRWKLLTDGALKKR